MSHGGFVQSSKWRLAFFISTGISLPVIAFLLYGIIDQGVTITYMSEGYDQTKKDLEVLSSVFPLDRYNKKDIVTILRRKNPDAFIVETACAVKLAGISFEFNKNGVLSAINTRAQYTSEKECDI
jgi:hypothetical protein